MWGSRGGTERDEHHCHLRDYGNGTALSGKMEGRFKLIDSEFDTGTTFVNARASMRPRQVIFSYRHSERRIRCLICLDRSRIRPREVLIG